MPPLLLPDVPGLRALAALALREELDALSLRDRMDEDDAEAAILEALFVSPVMSS